MFQHGTEHRIPGPASHKIVTIGLLNEPSRLNLLKPNDIYICRTAALTPDATF